MEIWEKPVNLGTNIQFMFFPARATGYLLLIVLFIWAQTAIAQKLQWSADGNRFYSFSDQGISSIDPVHPENNKVFMTQKELTPAGATGALSVQSFTISPDGGRILLFANTQRVWRENTRGDYWIFDRGAQKLTQLGRGLPAASLMFAKFSPDGKKVAYVSKHNIYIEDLQDQKRTAVTGDGTDRIINGTFDWAYEEEFGCQDGFRWSPDGSRIAYWKLDARNIRNFLMINNTDSLYPFTIPVEYPKVGQNPSACTIWLFDIANGKTSQAAIEGDPVQHYIPRMEWTPRGESVILQQLNRQQNDSRIFLVDAASAKARQIYHETDAAWIDIKSRWNDNDPSGWDWVNANGEFLWLSEKNGWRQIYKLDLTGKETLITREAYDVIQFNLFDAPTQTIYFAASPENATQNYLYKISLKGGKAVRVTPASLKGTNKYTISPNGKIAILNHSSATELANGAIVSLPDHRELAKARRVLAANAGDPKTEFFKLKTADGIELDGWMVKPVPFDPQKKYPVVFYVYGEPASQTVLDKYGTGKNFLYNGSMANDGYVYISLENRGAPAPKGSQWRKAIYRNIGRINIRDQAMGAKEILKWDFIDSSRVAVWGWSGGGSSTLNLLFQYPEIYKTGIAIAAVTNQLLYDNIYQERYMGVPVSSNEDFVKGSPITYARNLRGNLLYIHGTGDDNVHYQNAEMLINELIRQGKQFQLMSYPNRTHSISEGEGTGAHLSALYTHYLKAHCPPGGQ
ncbi:dipeptidyl-peptidase-4 [Niabella drilacis]|uniref:Dipeptidyl-peptidase-4 n=2 Tax=Niabella drilacis (strain DSM 25811 / CCM 8410 / CCUG 62505 / LMG 26954 / E90) TaxID=1285928 RepID=A0A1G6T5N9_NIADE|nr:dipeptidyl-peptidase-4 [Niabella drilacis]